VLGWTPRKPEIETMIADAWAWHQAHPDGYST
jgi:UDP-glucose 4-epimerase